MKGLLVGQKAVRKILDGEQTQLRVIYTAKSYDFHLIRGDERYCQEKYFRADDGDICTITYMDGTKKIIDLSHVVERGAEGVPSSDGKDMLVWMSRCVVRVTGVRLEIMKDITNDDAIAEGYVSRDDFIADWNNRHSRCYAFGAPRKVWIYAVKPIEIPVIPPRLSSEYYCHNPCCIADNGTCMQYGNCRVEWDRSVNWYRRCEACLRDEGVIK